MAYTFFCPNCGKRFDRDESLAGKKARCKDCQHVFVIPAVAGQRTAPAARSQPRPSSTRAATPAPSRPADDPYGLDESPSLPPARNPYAEPDEEFVSLQPIRPGTPVKRKPRTRSENEFAWLGQVTLGSIGIQVILALLLGFFALLELPTAAAIAGVILCLVSAGMLVLGLVVWCIVPFRESVEQGLLSLFLPFYSIYYLITRWASMKRPFFLLLSVNILPIAAALLLPAIAASRQAALRAEQKQQSPMADFAPRARVEPARPNSPPAPPGGISLVLNLSGNFDAKVGTALGRRLVEIAKELAPGIPVQARPSGRGNQLIFMITPVRDPQAYADRIDFGTVTSVEGRTIRVTASPESTAHLVIATPTPPSSEPGNATAPRTVGPRRFPRRPPIGGPRSP